MIIAGILPRYWIFGSSAQRSIDVGMIYFLKFSSHFRTLAEALTKPSVEFVIWVFINDPCLGLKMRDSKDHEVINNITVRND